MEPNHEGMDQNTPELHISLGGGDGSELLTQAQNPINARNRYVALDMNPVAQGEVPSDEALPYKNATSISISYVMDELETVLLKPERTANETESSYAEKQEAWIQAVQLISKEELEAIQKASQTSLDFINELKSRFHSNDLASKYQRLEWMNKQTYYGSIMNSLQREYIPQKSDGSISRVDGYNIAYYRMLAAAYASLKPAGTLRLTEPEPNIFKARELLMLQPEKWSIRYPIEIVQNDHSYWSRELSQARVVPYQLVVYKK